MVLNKKYTIKINTGNKRIYKYIDDIKIGDEITIGYDDISKYSHLLIDYLCDYCNKEIKIARKEITNGTKLINKMACKNCRQHKQKEIMLITHGVGNCSELNSIKQKKKDTLMKNYGVESPWLSSLIKEKRDKTMIERYGVINPMENNVLKEIQKLSVKNKYGVDNVNQNKFIKNKSKNTRIKKGNQISDELLSSLEKYKREVRIITYSYKKELFEKWNGYDYYDNEYIKNLTDRKNRPTIDHKISVSFGFKNNINPEIIGNISNLVITKGKINSQKNLLTEDEYKIKNLKIK